MPRKDPCEDTKRRLFANCGQKSGTESNPAHNMVLDFETLEVKFFFFFFFKAIPSMSLYYDNPGDLILQKTWGMLRHSSNHDRFHMKPVCKEALKLQRMWERLHLVSVD